MIFLLYLTLVDNAGVETVVQPVALEVYVFGNPFIERIVRQVIAVQLLGQIGIPNVV